MTVKEKIKAIAEKYGYDAQSRQCIEEMAELTQQSINFGESSWDVERFHSRMTRIHSLPLVRNTITWLRRLPMCEIMLWQMERFLHCNIDSIVERKLDRQMERIGNKNSD